MSSRRAYVPKPKSVSACATCASPFVKFKPQHYFCSHACFLVAYKARRNEGRTKPRSCKTCGVAVEPKPGPPVCSNCVVDKRPRHAKERNFRRQTLRKYGLTEATFEALLAEQDGHCAICRTGDPGVKGWAVDHCHANGYVRGVLCGRCNTAIGLLREDPTVAANAAMYLDKWQPKAVAS